MAEGARTVVAATASIGDVVEENAAATQEMAGQAAEVAQAARSIAAVSERNGAASADVAASAQEVAARVESMGVQAEELAATAAQLREALGRFGTARATGRAPSPPPAAHPRLDRAEGWAALATTGRTASPPQARARVPSG
jgi:hypothetical protein